MAIFGKDVKDARDGRETFLSPEPRQQNAPGGGGGGEASLSVIAAGMRIVGDVETEGVVKIEGRIEGAVRAARQVLIGRQGEVSGDITTREAIIAGKVNGTITASERLEAQNTCNVVGDIHTKSIAVVEGARINGNVRIADAVAPPDRADARAEAPQPPKG